MGATPARQARISNPVFARTFPRLSQAMEAGGMATRRNGLLAGLTGQVIDIGAGYRDIVAGCRMACLAGASGAARMASSHG